ncbi:MAG TPA: hypothetical protein VGJ02_05685 [Pyrinomonadaceae bacterium]
MKRFAGHLSLLLWMTTLIAASVGAQNHPQKVKSQEISDDGLPVIVKHLPDWESKQHDASFVTNGIDLSKALGDRPVLNLIDFADGTEAVTAPYPAGKLVIVEFTNPQASIDADNTIQTYLAQNADAGTVYRRTGNYNIFVFDSPDPIAAANLIDQVKYEKNVQWLGEDPFMFHNLERRFVNTTADIFVSTVEWIVLGIGIALLLGVILGYLFFQFRERQRLTMNEFSDAGGMVRLNLDGLTSDLAPEKLLSK